METVNLETVRSLLGVRGGVWVAKSIAKSIALGSLAMLQACTVNAPSCDGRFEPINLPAPVEDGSAHTKVSSAEDQSS